MIIRALRTNSAAHSAGGRSRSAFREAAKTLVIVLLLGVEQSLQIIREQLATTFADVRIADALGRRHTRSILHLDRLLLAPCVESRLLLARARETKSRPHVADVIDSLARFAYARVAILLR